MWRDGKAPASRPTTDLYFRRLSLEIGSATDQYYYHYFYAEQPDHHMAQSRSGEGHARHHRWLYKRGVSGFVSIGLTLSSKIRS